ncbi:uncharacterized protein CEXT_19811 [Caerostris extrusa]|uniref:EGF-like domain-containing protein n=1 Tax=Caerostris extrusa TaxID=172846 RepID=A0AAV4XVA4_CAEEX|nr:uncharacterized protein CEXT_19811 [Caerostris extrusa]
MWRGKKAKNSANADQGVVGDTCKTVVVCKSGIYKDCKDDAGTCSFDLDTNAAVCKCSGHKKLNDQKHKCEETCKGNDECKNGGTCGEKEGNKFCQCRTGVEGDTCETVVECKSGIYKDCKDDAGKCSFDLKTNAAVCVCSGNKKLNDKEFICEDCACGENEECSFKDGEKNLFMQNWLRKR